MDKSWNYIYLTLWILLHYTGFSNAVDCGIGNDCSNGGTCTPEGLCDCLIDFFGTRCDEMKALVGFEDLTYNVMEVGDSGTVQKSVYITREGNLNMVTNVLIMTMMPNDRPQEEHARIGVDFTFSETTERFNDATMDSMGTDRRKIDFQLILDDVPEGPKYFDFVLDIDSGDMETARVLADRRFTRVKIEASDGWTAPEGPCFIPRNPCENGGRCTPTGPDEYSCACTADYLGDNCTVINPCLSGPCLNNGTCYVSSDSSTAAYNCGCTDVFEGDTCADAVKSGDVGGPGNSNNQGGIGDLTLIIIVSVVAALILIIFIIVLVVCLKRRQNKNQPRGAANTRDNTYAERVVYRNEASGNTTQIQSRQRGHRRQGTVYDKAERKIGAEFPRQSLKLHEHLGSGAFANVVRADAMGIVKKRKSTVVAVKMLKELATESDRSDFMKELKVYRMLEPHPNIIVMLGCCTEIEPYYLIMEYAPHGSLQSHLREIRNAPESPYSNVEGKRRECLTPTEILQFGRQIAYGMKYLASKQCIHRDLATRNILLGDGFVCKLSDFGLARDISEQNAYEMQSRGRVPVRWMAIESLLENSYTSKSDVWSFGVTMWELVTLGSHPYPGMSSKKVISELQKGYRLPKPDHCSQDIYSMMKECWQGRPETRPSFDQLHSKLEQMLEDAQGYLQMTEFKAADYIYLDPEANSDSSIENDEHGGATGVVGATEATGDNAGDRTSTGATPGVRVIF